MKSDLKGLPQPVSIPVPSAVDGEPDLREKMMKQELPIAPEIAQVLAVGMGLELLGFGLGQGHGLGCFAGNADVIEMNGMIEPVLRRNDDDGALRYFLIHSDVNAEKKADDQETDHNDSGNFTLLRSSHRSVLQQDPRLNKKQLYKLGGKKSNSVVFVVFRSRKRKLEELDLLLSQHLLLFTGRRSLDVLLFTDSVVHFEGLRREVGAHILEIPVHVVDNLFRKPPVVNGLRSLFSFGPCRLCGHRRQHPPHTGILTNRARHQLFASLLLKGGAAVEPALKAMAVRTLQVKYNQESSSLRDQLPAVREAKEPKYRVPFVLRTSTGSTPEIRFSTSQRKEQLGSLSLPGRDT